MARWAMRVDRDSFALIYGDESTAALDASEVATALIGVSTLIAEAGRLTYARDEQVKVLCRPFKEGPFQTDLDLVMPLTQGLVVILTADGISALSNMLSLLGVNGIPGAFQLLGFTRNREVVEVLAPSPANSAMERVRVRDADGNEAEAEFSRGASAFIQTPSVQIAINDVLRPVRDGSCEQLRIAHRGVDRVALTAADRRRPTSDGKRRRGR